MTIGCLTVTLERVGGITASMTRVRKPLTVSMQRVGGMTVSMGLVCGTSLDSGTILWASDEKLLTVDNGYLYVTEK